MRETKAEEAASIADELLCVRGLDSGYGDVKVLWGIDLDVARRAIVSIVGANGAGKTTLLLTLSGMVKASRGSWRIGGKEMAGRSPGEIVAAGISHVPEGRRLFKTLSIRDNLLLGAYHRRDRAATLQDLE